MGRATPEFTTQSAPSDRARLPAASLPPPGRYRYRIRRWYLRNGRVLPWRGIRDHYRILVSEVMLQQTQVARVLEKYPAFLARFPSVFAMAAAQQRDVVRAWQGMGYNNRPVRLHQLARRVMCECGGRLPRDLEGLTSLPGIGRYTAHAVLSSAFGKPVPVVDINVRRLLSRLFFRMETTDRLRPEAEIWITAGRVLPRGRTYEWNQALMDLGATVCTARAPRCSDCPVMTVCRSYRRMRHGTHRKIYHEPSLYGIPNRIYRGKIVEMLRRSRRPISVSAVARVLLNGSSLRHQRWLNDVLAGLARDGLIRVSTGGHGRSRRVTLA